MSVFASHIFAGEEERVVLSKDLIAKAGASSLSLPFYSINRSSSLPSIDSLCQFTNSFIVDKNPRHRANIRLNPALHLSLSHGHVSVDLESCQWVFDIVSRYHSKWWFCRWSSELSVHMCDTCCVYGHCLQSWIHIETYSMLGNGRSIEFVRSRRFFSHSGSGVLHRKLRRLHQQCSWI